MPTPDSLFAEVDSIDAPVATQALLAADAPPTTRVTFTNGARIHLDLRRPAHRIIKRALDTSLHWNFKAFVPPAAPVGAAAPLALAHTSVVEHIAVDPANGATYALRDSQGVHTISARNPYFSHAVDLLHRSLNERIPISVAEDDRRQLIAATADPDARPADAGPSTDCDIDILSLPTVDRATAAAIFANAQRRACAFPDPDPACVPFDYPDDGCWARAHEMVRLNPDAAAVLAKVWSYGALTAGTTCNPDCRVHWFWHVAPVVRLDESGTVTTCVIDPSLFDRPATLDEWKGAQGDPNVEIAFTSVEAFLRSKQGTLLDADYAKTDRTLAFYRAQLLLRSASPAGPPPYAQCALH